MVKYCPKKLPRRIDIHHRVIFAIRKQVITEQPAVELPIRIDKPTGIRIVVSGLEVVQIRFRIQIIPPIAERVHCADAVGICQDGAVAPRRSRIASVAVTCDLGAVCVVDCDDVAENVLLVQIIIKLFICVGRVAVHHAHRKPVIVVEVHEQLIAPFLRDDPVAVPAGYPAGT